MTALQDLLCRLISSRGERARCRCGAALGRSWVITVDERFRWAMMGPIWMPAFKVGRVPDPKQACGRHETDSFTGG